MLLRRSQAYPDLWERKRFTGPLDIRAPEDRPVIEQEKARGKPIRSPEIGKVLRDFGVAMQSGMVDEMRRAAGEVVDATSAHFRASGVPVFAHDPVPPQLIKIALPLDQLAPGGHAKQAVENFLHVFHKSVRPMLREQVLRHLESGAEAEDGQAAGNAPDEESNPRERQFASLLTQTDTARARSPRGASQWFSAEPPAAAPPARRDLGIHPEPLQAAARADGASEQRLSSAPLGSDSGSERLVTGDSPDETDERLGDYNRGNVAEVVDDAIAELNSAERLSGMAGTKVRNKGRYVWTRYGWVDLQHVVSAATSANDPYINFLLGLGFEGLQFVFGIKALGGNPKYWSSFMRKEDLFSNWIGARALWHQQRSGGTIGYWVARLLKEYGSLSLKEAAKFLALGGKAEKLVHWKAGWDIGF